VAAVSGDDADNLVVTALARFEYAAGRTIARIVDPVHAWLFDEGAGVDVAVDQAELLTRLIAHEVPPEQEPP
jgi:trk system potassium uptake protein